VKVLISIVAVSVLFAVGMLGAGIGLEVVFGVVVPYLAAVLLLGGLVYRVLQWANVPVPFRIPTTSGQQSALPWIKSSKLDNPSSTLGVVGRMLLEVLFFRSLLKNTRTELQEGKRLIYSSSLWLWIGALAFHWSMLIIVLRHLRFFINPVPGLVVLLQSADGFLQIGVPEIYITSILFLAALLYLLARRLTIPQLRYISLPNDYFPLFLLLGIGLSGFWLRHIAKTDIVAVKEMVLGLVTLSPRVVEGVAPLFYGHLFLVSVLLIYFPLSKLMHAPGVFLSPTRNLANTNRRVRHINPWNRPVKVHTYEEYENEWREKMKKAGIPVEQE
jgi:nitrate reductase gamma subunit